MPDSADSIGRLTELVRGFRDERDWKQFHQPKDLFLSLVLEAGELAELSQWREGSELKAYLEENREKVEDEVADVLYWVLLIADELGVDLAAALEAKLVKNGEKYPVTKARGRKEKYSEL